MTTRNAEFAVGTGSQVIVDLGKKNHPLVHVSLDCPARSRSTVGIYPTEKMARAAIPGVKACKTCRPA